MKNLFIGIDFSKEKIDVTIITAQGLEELSARSLKHSLRQQVDIINLLDGWRKTPLVWKEIHGSSVEKIQVITANPYAITSMEKDLTCG